MNDITELAMREKFEAWVITQICISKITLEGLRTPDGYRNSTLSGRDYNLMWNLWKAAGAELVEALEKAQQRIAELESSGVAPGILRCTECSFVQTKNIISVTADTITTVESESEPCPNGCGSLQPVTWKALAIQLMFTTKQGVSELQEAKKRISELESFRTAYMEWGDKTDWVQGDKRFDVLIPWGKHRADVLKAYIELLESRTVTVKLSKDHVDDADLFGWGVVVVPLEALKDACVNAGVTVEIADDGIKVEAE